ncbi:hypothetical protein HG702_02205 [Pectobacterium versatile]|nr:hypothetical protein HG702_02205 [Pectobacterium versatile]
MKLHHFGFLSKKLNETVDTFTLLGHKIISDIIRDDIRGVDIVFLTSDTNELIEIVSPYTENSIVKNLIKKSNNNLYHIAYSVDDIDEKILNLQHKGFILIDPLNQLLHLMGKKLHFLFLLMLG